MSIGTTLAQARRDAGLTVTEISEKTRIRETIIRGIERDDYSACGGDFYARGHIRAIARVVRTDPVPLIEEYDTSFKAPDEITAAEAFRPTMGLSDREAAAERAQARERRLAAERRPAEEPRTAPGGIGTTELPPGDRLPWEGARPGAKTETLSDALPSGDTLAPGETGTLQDAETPPDGMVPLEALLSGDTGPDPGEPAGMGTPGGTPSAGETTPVTDPLSTQALQARMSDSVRRRRRPQLNWTSGLGVAVLAAVALLGYFLAAGPGHPVASPRTQSHKQAAKSNPRRSPAAVRSTPAQPLVQALSPVSAEAFGPSGAGQGDDPQLAQGVITGGTWHTDWYASAAFGNLQQGTGLLLDMGKTVTVTKAQLTLGNPTGADLQLRVGDTPTLAALQPVAGATNAGGVLQLNPTNPVTGRYVLIWFTSLPPDTSGTFQASISGVQLQGQA